jgi:hypothetical protein
VAPSYHWKFYFSYKHLINKATNLANSLFSNAFNINHPISFFCSEKPLTKLATLSESQFRNDILSSSILKN